MSNEDRQVEPIKEYYIAVAEANHIRIAREYLLFLLDSKEHLLSRT